MKTLININPNVSVTKKPFESKMGKGKGSISYFVAPVLSGQKFIVFKGIRKLKSITFFKNLSRQLRLNFFVVTKKTRWIL